MGCGSSMQVHPATEGGAETNAMQAMAQQIAALRSENVELQKQLTSTRSELADDKQTIVTLKEQLTASTSTRFDNVALQQLQEQLTSTRSELADDKQTIAALQKQLTALASTLSENVGLREQLTSTRCELADAVIREQVATGRLSVLVNMDKDEKDLAERISTLKLELAELETSACSASQGALSTVVETSTSAQITAQAYPAASPAQVLGDTPVEAAVLEMDPTKSDEAARDFKMRLGMRIAAGPDAFFALADTKQEDILSPQGWLEACKSSLGKVDETLCRSIFDQMDLDKDGRVSREEFIDMRNAIRLFLKDAKCQEMLIEVLAGLVAAHWKVGGDDDTSVADKTTQVLTKLSVDEFRKEVAAVLPQRLKERGDEVKREREERKKKLQVDQGQGKFVDLPTAAYGTKDDFHKGLEIIGQPHSNTLEQLIKECQDSKDSNDEFEAGKNITTPKKELDFVMDPYGFKHSDNKDWQEKDPKDWKPKHEFGGERNPIRLEVFMHVLSGTEEGESGSAGTKSATRFGEYKLADQLDKKDPRWLHAKEVDMVKLVLCRVIKSQVTSQSLLNAFAKAVKKSPTDVHKAPPKPALSLKQAEVRAARIKKALSKGLGDGGDGSDSKCTFAFVLQTVLKKKAATEWELEALLDHFHALFASKPMNECEVIAGRAYTGPLYVKMNSSLRKASKKFGEQAHLKGNSYTNLIYACNSLLRKFSEISIIPPGRKVSRGMSGVILPGCFKKCAEGGGRGGVDFGFLSTTTNESVAVSFLGGKEMPVLFQFDVGDIDRGASLSFLSQYPNEDEVLIPPLSYLEVTGEPFFMNTDKGEVTVYPARINCNLRSKTIEEIKGHRQKEILAMLPYLKGALQRDMPVLVEALAADFKEKAEETQLKKLDALQAQISRDFDALSTDLETPEKMSWLNQDSNYKQSICEVIDFKLVRMSRLVRELSALDEEYLEDPLTTNLHVAAREGRTKTVAALLSFGADADAKDKGGMTAMALACVKVGNMEKLSWGGASADEAPPGLAVGRWVRATVTFTTNSEKEEEDSEEEEEAEEVRKDSLGVVAEIDEDGDASIDFEGLDAKQWVLKSKFGNISVLSQEDVLKERAQREEVVAMLIAPTQAAGALNEANNEGATPLMHASMRGLCGVVELLLAAGADVATKDKNGKGVFDHTKEIKDEEKRVAVLALMAEYSVLCAVATGKADLVAAAVAKGCNMIDTDLAGNTAVELAQNAQTIDVLKGAGATMPEFPEEKKNDLLIEYAEKGATGGALMALQAGADVNHKGEFSRTALHEAAEKGHEALAQCLLGAGADIKAADVTGSTPLHWAAYSNKPEVAKVLLANGAQVNVRNTRGRTALALARLHRNREMEALLLQHGAECSPSGALDFGSLIFTET